ncbi:unnamed protein product, partial [Urochloa humidicola]
GILHGAHERHHLAPLAGVHGQPAPKPEATLLPLPRVVLGQQDGGDRAGGGLRVREKHVRAAADDRARRRGGNFPGSNTLVVGDAATVVCLDDYHSLDRAARTARGV